MQWRLTKSESRSRNPWATRFAPSPTGFLHRGHVASALCVFGIARALDADVLVRVEDHDRGRARKAYEDAIDTDLTWLGLVASRRARQSDHPERYATALETLAVGGRLYGCDCSRKRLAEGLQGELLSELRYDGHCRERGLDWRDPALGVRVRLGDETVSFDDAILGPQTQTPAAQCGDPLLRDRHGNFTYLLAVVVDDHVEGVNLVVRGADLTASTGRQILLARLLGRAEPPAFAHHPLLVDAEGKKLGKRFFSAAIAQERAAGVAPEQILGEVLHHLGLAATAAPLTTAAALAAVAAARRS